MNILVTGFEAFLDNQKNPTQEVVRLLPNTIKGHKIIGIELPVIYKESFEILKKNILTYEPEIVICLGLASNRSMITPERIAININDSLHPDNAGNVLVDLPIIPSGKNAYFSSLPIKKIVSKLTEKHIKSKISNSAGLYVCNDLMYRLLHFVEVSQSQIKAGFIHVPLMKEQTDSENAMPLNMILESVIEAIKLSL